MNEKCGIDISSPIRPYSGDSIVRGNDGKEFGFSVSCEFGVGKLLLESGEVVGDALHKAVHIQEDKEYPSMKERGIFLKFPKTLDGIRGINLLIMHLTEIRKQITEEFTKGLEEKE